MKKKRIDIFGDGMRIFLDYITRQFKKNPDYDPHPLVKALELAVSGIKDKKNGERAIGLSGNHLDDTIYNPYVVAVVKREDGIEVEEIRNIQVNKELPLDLMIMIFRLQIILDRIPGDSVSPIQMAESLNKIIPEKPFFALGERWREARNKFKKMMEAGKIHIPNDPKIVKEISKIKFDIPWEKYSNFLRSIIGTCFCSEINKKNGGKICITTPTKYKIEKFKVFDMLTEYVMGGLSNKLKKGERNKG